jgi:homoserine O-acetyltransferase
VQGDSSGCHDDVEESMGSDDGRAPLSISALPVTGAWRRGDPAGDRRFLRLATTQRFHLEGGSALHDIDIAYETWGQLDDRAANAILLCHALTGDSHAAGRAGPGHPEPGWWDSLVGSGKAFDTDRYFIVCANVLGGCQGSTGPASLEPGTGRAYGSRFPVVSIRDMVRTQAALADHLGVDRWLTVAGGSMGGMQVLEWGVMYPERVRSLLPIATAAATTAQQIAYSMVQRSSIELDANWRGGDYYDAPFGEGPARGLANARALAHVTYRSDEIFSERFGRNVVDRMDRFDLWQRFDVEGYLDYQGAKLARRFDANSYLYIAKAMDLHDIGRGRGGIVAALGRIRCPVLTLSVRSDALFRPSQQEQIRDALLAHHLPVDHVVIDSPHGHDAFLLEDEQIGDAVVKFLATVQ